jgi:hypothetical protein
MSRLHFVLLHTRGVEHRDMASNTYPGVQGHERLMLSYVLCVNSATRAPRTPNSSSYTARPFPPHPLAELSHHAHLPVFPLYLTLQPEMICSQYKSQIL